MISCEYMDNSRREKEEKLQAKIDRSFVLAGYSLTLFGWGFAAAWIIRGLM